MALSSTQLLTTLVEALVGAKASPKQLGSGVAAGVRALLLCEPGGSTDEATLAPRVAKIRDALLVKRSLKESGIADHSLSKQIAAARSAGMLPLEVGRAARRVSRAANRARHEPFFIGEEENFELLPAPENASERVGVQLEDRGRGDPLCLVAVDVLLPAPEHKSECIHAHNPVGGGPAPQWFFCYWVECATGVPPRSGSFDPGAFACGAPRCSGCSRKPPGAEGGPRC